MFDYAVVRLTPDGAAQRFPVAVSDQSSYLPAITAGPDGNLWATKRSADAIVRVTPSGGVTEFGAEAQGFITPGPDGALWFDSTHGIGRITTSGVTTYFPTNSFTYGVAFGSDRNIWFAEADGKIGRMTPSGSVTYFPVQHSPRGVTRGSDGNIWFYGSAGVGRVTPNGNVQEISVGGADGQAVGITTGPDGNVWFMQGGGPGIGRVKPDMTVDFFGVGPTDLYASAMKGIISGPDGFLWFTTNGEVDRFAPPKS
jgi:virginiamycin B lyase